MDSAAKRTALRAITYGLVVVTAKHDGRVAGACINWLTQTSFEPPLVALGIKADSETHAVAKSAGRLAVNVLAHDQFDIAKSFFRPTEIEGTSINGFEFEDGPVTGAPLLLDAPYWWEAIVLDVLERGDHSLFLTEVVEAGVRDESRAPLELRPTGLNYGG